MKPKHVSPSWTLALSGILLFVGCDDAKKFIDPTGKAYGTPASKDESKPREDAAQKAPAKAPEPAMKEPAAKEVPKLGKAGTNHAPATYRDAPPLTSRSAMDKAQNMLMTTPQGWVEFAKGRAISRGRHLTLWDRTETPWGLGIVDLDQDGADDAILAVRSTSPTDTSWLLAVLMDRSGKLQCIQSIPLNSVDKIRSLESTQGGVLVIPENGSPQLFGWVGGELVGNP